MAADYDLVIIGSSRAGIYAARHAAQLQARVALVTQSEHLYLPEKQLISYELSKLRELNHKLVHDSFGSEKEQSNLFLSSALNLQEGLKATSTNGDSLSDLAVLGVDIISGWGKFNNQPQLELQVNQRKLRSRNFLLATGTNICPRFAEQQDRKTYLTLQDLTKIDLSALAKQIIIVGSNPIALELAQTLRKLNKDITLVIESSRILPQEDLEVTTLIQAHLEAEGIKILTNSPVSQIKQIEQQRWLQAGDRALSGGEIIVTDHHQPNISGLNLAVVNVKFNQHRVFVNQKLQTTNSHIYACGEMIGGYCLPNIAQYEASLVLQNTLFFPWYKVNYLAQPWAVLTEPNLARIGLNEAQAKQQHGKDIYVINHHFTDLSSRQPLDNQGFCKLLVQENGSILGCSLVSDRAAELISVVAQMIKHKIKLQPNPIKGLSTLAIPAASPSLVDIFNQASENFYLQKLSRQPKLLNRLRGWFAFRKNWH